MNQVILEGKVLSSYIHESGAYVIKLAVVHDHKIGEHNLTTESVLTAVAVDSDVIKSINVLNGDKVRIEGYLKLDIHRSPKGNCRQRISLYIKNVKLL